MKIPRNTRIYGFNEHNGMGSLDAIDSENYLEFAACQ
jgi:hypothetical protein